MGAVNYLNIDVEVFVIISYLGETYIPGYYVCLLTNAVLISLAFVNHVYCPRIREVESLTSTA